MEGIVDEVHREDVVDLPEEGEAALAVVLVAGEDEAGDISARVWKSPCFPKMYLLEFPMYLSSLSPLCIWNSRLYSSRCSCKTVNNFVGLKIHSYPSP